MIIIYSNRLPVKGFRAINLFGIVFARKEYAELDKRVQNHESIHTRQMLEMVVIGFYLWYVLEWIIKWIRYKDRLRHTGTSALSAKRLQTMPISTT